MKLYCLFVSCAVLSLVGCTSSMRFSSTLASGQIGCYTVTQKPQRISSLPTPRSDNEKLTSGDNDKLSLPTALSADSIPSSFRGLASYYGNEFNGRMTSSGEIFDQSRFTAAHRSLPFGTFLLVTNPKNNATVVVRVNDRGPFKMERVLDLSQAAAEELDMLRDGVLEVSVRVIE